MLLNWPASESLKLEILKSRPHNNLVDLNGFTPAEAVTNAEQKVGGRKADFIVREISTEEFRTLERYL